METHQVFRSVVLGLVLLPSSLSAANQQKTIPIRFQGEWNSNLQHCGTGLDDSRLRISADRVRFYESGGPVRAVVTQGEFDLALILELSGEGETWISFSHFRLSPDRSYLSDVTSKESGIVRYRCPKATGSGKRL